MSDDLKKRLRKRSTAIFLATEEGPATDLSNHLREAADCIEALEAQLADKRSAEELETLAWVETINDRRDREIRMLKVQLADAREVLDSIRQSLSEMLFGRADGPDNRDWQRAAVIEMRDRARAALPKDQSEVTK